MEIGNFGKGRCGNVNVSPLVVAVHPLTARQDLPHFGLCQILILSKIPNPAIIGHNHTPSLRCNYYTLESFSLLTFSEFFARLFLAIGMISPNGV